MRKILVVLVGLAASLSICAATGFAQGRAKTGPDLATIRDAELEKDSLHNLEVARHYFKQKKAYLAALKRCEEIDAGNPNFAKLDEVLYIAGESSLKLAETGGIQKTKKVMPDAMIAKGTQETKYKTPDELRLDARMYLSRLVTGYPNSAFRSEAEARLESLGGPLAPEPTSNPQP
ncbi:MAG TPA: outer membrane protein assembly factor BamD [Pyrinomonadaceae bacterium]|jgi:outer membrane protein assembly factor BamD (BamD/ComL family)|nr:outer membrane protein assembly factor BamD [Pyrinomonadaceae bacterium]